VSGDLQEPSAKEQQNMVSGRGEGSVDAKEKPAEVLPGGGSQVL